MSQAALERKSVALRNFAFRAIDAGQDAKAAHFFEQALAISPFRAEDYVLYAQLLGRIGQHEQIIDLCNKGLSFDNNATTLHKLAIDAMVHLQGIEYAFGNYRLVRVDERPLLFSAEAILCCCVIRNEYPRLPYFLDYYRQLGVERFFFVDNGSSDRSIDYLLAQPDAYLWSSDLPFGTASFGSAWFELLLRRYGIGHWWVMADADELLLYADSETRSLRAFCQMLAQNNKQAATGLMIDFYSDRAVQETAYAIGSDFFESCAYFDRWQTFRILPLSSCAKTQDYIFGGTRQRLFPSAISYLVSKTPLLFYSEDTLLEAGQHATNVPTQQVAHDVCTVAHFKFFASFVDYAHQEARREQHSAEATQYKAYVRELEKYGSMTLYDEQFSIRYENTAQLKQLGFLQPEPGAYQASAWIQQLHPSNKCSPK